MSCRMSKLESVSFGTTLKPPDEAEANRLIVYTSGSLRRRTIVLGSGAVIDSTGARESTALATDERAGLLATKRSQENSTSWTSKARPLTGALSCQRTPGRSFSVIERPSGDHSHNCARSGAISPSDGPRCPGWFCTKEL